MIDIHPSHPKHSKLESINPSKQPKSTNILPETIPPPIRPKITKENS